MKKVVLALAAAALGLAGWGETAVVDGIEWGYEIADGGNAILIGAKVDGWRRKTAIPTSTSGAVVIPSSLDGHPVTSIGDSAFSGCKGLTAVTFPQGVTNIGERAF